MGGVLRAAGAQRCRQHPLGLFLRVLHRRRALVVAVVVIVVGAGGVGGDVGVVAVPAAGHRDVQVFAVHPGADQHDPEVGGRALGGVDRGRPAVLGVLGQIRRRQHHPAAAGEVFHDQTVFRTGPQDLVAVAVADMAVADLEPPVVAPGPEQVAGLPVPTPSCGDRAGDLTRRDGGGAGPQVQLVDVQPGPGEHQRVQAVSTGLSPVPERAVQRGVTVSAGVQPAGGAVVGQRVRLPLTECHGCLSFPGLAEPVDLSELDAVPGPGEGREHPARTVDDPDLGGVPDQHDLRPDLSRGSDQRVEVQRRRHRRLIHDHHSPAGQPRRPGRSGRGAVMGVEPFGERVGRAAGRGGEFGGGPGRRRQPDDLIAGDLPSAGGGAQRAGLARPGRRGQDRQKVPTAGQVQHRPVLTRIQPSVATQRHQRGQRNPAVPALAPAVGDIEDPGLSGQDLHRGVPGIGGPCGHPDAAQPDRDCVVHAECGVGELLDPVDDLSRTAPCRRQQGGDLSGDVGAGEHRPPATRPLQRRARHPCRQDLIACRQDLVGRRQDLRQQDPGRVRAVSVGLGHLRRMGLGKT